MNLHTADLTQRLSDYLARRVPPKGIGSDEKLKADQVKEYISILRRFAPEGDKLVDWWGAFIERLADNSETWAWPSPKEVAKSAKAAGESTVGKKDGWKPDSAAINLARLNSGEPIGEDWLWGAGAMRLEAAGASRHQLRARRIEMAKAMAETYPEEDVKRRLLELKERHEKARAYVDDVRMGRHQASIPDKRAFTDAELEALVE